MVKVCTNPAGTIFGGAGSLEELEEAGNLASVGGGIPNVTGLNVLARYALCGTTGLTYGTVGCTRGLGIEGALLEDIVDDRLYNVVCGRLSEVTTGLIFSNDCNPALVAVALIETVWLVLTDTAVNGGGGGAATAFDPTRKPDYFKQMRTVL